MNKNFIIFRTNTSNNKFMTEFLLIDDNLSIEDWKKEILKLLDKYNVIEVKRYWKDVFKRTLKDIIGYIPQVWTEKEPISYWKYENFEQIPENIAIESWMPTLTLYTVKSFELNKNDILITM